MVAASRMGENRSSGMDKIALVGDRGPLASLMYFDLERHARD